MSGAEKLAICIACVTVLGLVGFGLGWASWVWRWDGEA